MSEKNNIDISTDRDETLDIIDKLEKALNKLGDEINMDISFATVRGNNNSFSTTLTAKKKSINGVSFEQIEFEKFCKIYGFKNEDYNKIIIYNGDDFQVKGFNTRAPKYPVKMLRLKDNANYTFTLDMVRELLK